MSVIHIDLGLSIIEKRDESCLNGKIQIVRKKYRQAFKYRHEVPDDILTNEFDYQLEKGWIDDNISDGYILYRRNWYHLDQFMRIGYPFDTMLDLQSVFTGWHGYLSDTYFSGILIRLYDDDLDKFAIAEYYS